VVNPLRTETAGMRAGRISGGGGCFMMMLGSSPAHRWICTNERGALK
jgi:hypothetical protein